LEGKTIVYTGDCGVTDSLKEFVRDADFLISECGAKELSEDKEWGHLDPVLASTMAKEANVKKLVLTHFGSAQFLTLEDRKEAERTAQAIFPNTTAATDDLKITL
jgi:ribonuclease BN (tRNA processing enzyme)